jgi:UDP-2,3-diacylglucosamine hydrolase
MHSALPVVPAAAPELDRVTLQAPVFISDLHLNASQPRTLQRFVSFVQGGAAGARELVILGDLFEYWAGDDDDDAVGRTVAGELRRLADRGVAVHLMHGNRDLLLGRNFAQRAGATLLADPTLATIGSETVLLAHGDAWCTRDEPYMRFRAQVRNAAFQRMFLDKPLAERRAFIGQARAASEAGKQTKSMDIMDVTPEVVTDAMRAAGVRKLIHGHTHRPATHCFDIDGAAVERWVLPDWDYDAPQVRGGYLGIEGGRWEMRSIV